MEDTDKITIQPQPKNTEHLLRSLVEGTASVTGDAFFRSVVRHLASALEVDYAFVGRFAADSSDTAQALAFWTRNELSSPFSYSVKGTPCAEVLAGKVALYQDNVTALFPDDQTLIDLDIRSYLGVPIYGSAGFVIGHVAVLDTKPMQDHAWMQSVLKIFASRAGAEIERQELERKLQETVDRYALATGAANAGVWDWNVETDELFLDPNIKTTLGFADEEVPNTLKGWLRHVHPEDRDPLMGEARACIDGEKPEYLFEHRVVHKDGSVRWALVRGRTILDSDGRVVRMIGTNTDITDRKNLEGQLFQAKKMESVGLLAGGIAHDFNNLLTIILGLTKEIQLDAKNTLTDEIDDIQHAAERAALLTRQLLAFSRRQVLQPKVLEPNELIVNLVGLVKRLLGKNVRVETNLDPKAGCVKADPVQMEQIIMNLAANARDAMPDGGQLTIETANVELDPRFVETHPGSVEGSFVRVRLKDDGVGMDPGTMDRIFEPFFTTKDPRQGTGLGLSMVYGIVKQSEGYVTAESRPDEGTVFDVYLPRVEKAGSVPAVELPATQRGAETVLLVEDESSLRRFVRRAMERAGYTVLEASDGEDAIAVFRKHGHEIRAILTDVVMPRMGGAQLVEEIRKSQPDIGVVFMSGYTDQADKHVLSSDNSSAFIQKPFSIEALTVKLRGVIDEVHNTV